MALYQTAICLSISLILGIITLVLLLLKQWETRKEFLGDRRTNTMTKAVVCAAILLVALGMPGHAQDAGQKPLPAIVQKYVAMVQSTPMLYADAAQVGTKDTARVEIASPNKIKIVSVSDGKTSTLVCDGKQVRQWNAVNVATSPAPATLDKLDPPMPMGAAASIAFSLLTDSSSITDYANLRDMGLTRMHGTVVHKVVSVEDSDTATFWLDSDTGLPLQASYTGGRRDRVIALQYRQLNREVLVSQVNKDEFITAVFHAVKPEDFQEQPPVGLAAYVPKPTPSLLPVGTNAPDFVLPYANGSGANAQTLALSSLKGQVVLIDFWASWCRPCKKTMPHIQELRQTLGPRGLTVLSINTWDSAPRMQAFLAAHPQYTSTFLYDARPGDQSIASSKYHVWGIPTVYVIGKDGKVAGAFIGDDPQAAAQIEQTLAHLGVN